MKKSYSSLFWGIVFSLALLKIAIHFWTNTNYEIHRDGLLYYSLSEHLAWGYVSVPPLIAFLTKGVTTILGTSTFALRFLPAIVGFLSVILIGRIVWKLGGNWVGAFFACSAFIFSPAFLRSNTLLQPVSVNQFFWLLLGYLLLRLIQTKNTRIWWIMGFVAGLAFLNKYSIVFFIFGMFVSFIFTKYRNLMATRDFWGALLLGVVIILPNLLWQYEHNWPVVHHMKELHSTQLVHVEWSSFLLNQLVSNFPVIPVWGLGLLGVFVWKEERTYRIFGFLYFSVLLVLLAGSGKAYYSLGLYPILYAFGGYFIGKYLVEKWRMFQYVIFASMVLLSLFALPYSLPILNFDRLAAYVQSTKKVIGEGPVTWEDGKVYPIPQDYADMTGWKELGQQVVHTYQSLDVEEKDQCVIFAGSYGTAGAILLYGKKAGLPHPICFSDSFLLWAPDSINPSTFLYVDYRATGVKDYFGSVEEVSRVEDPYFRCNGLAIFKCTNPKPSFLNHYKKVLDGLRTNYQR